MTYDDCHPEACTAAVRALGSIHGPEAKELAVDALEPVYHGDPAV